MTDLKPTGQELLEMVKTGQLTPEQGVTFYAEQKISDTKQKPTVSGQSRRWRRPRNNQTNQTPANEKNKISDKKIAIIGVACRYPDADNINEFWNNLVESKDSVSEISRWKTDQFYHPDPRTPGKSPSKWGGFLTDIDRFDPLFFNISPKEAELMDPQQRLFLEESWKALEDAGYSGQILEDKKCGVFIGFSASDYEDLLKERGIKPDSYVFTGNSESILSGRISYFLNLKGPAVTINTACSSSLAAIHLAYESICAETCDMAIAGGVQVMNTPDLYIKTGGSGMLSPVGKCKAFDNSADGFVPGEGVGILVLKSLETARQDNDHIYGIIIGSSMNQDGRSNGITAPSAPSQTTLELEVYRQNNIHPETITYIETHGTGTKLGDPIEVQALTDSFRKHTDKIHFCALGSVKTNIGHTLAAAGAAGFIKALLCLHQGQLVPSLHFRQPNEHIAFKNSPFYVNTKLQEWTPPTGVPRRAAVSSFGFSGTNVHMVLEEYEKPGNKPFNHTSEEQLVVLSARTLETLKRYAQKLYDFLEKNQSIDLKDIAYTLQMGRQPMENRLAVTASTITELKEKLSGYINGKNNRPTIHQGSITQDNNTIELLSDGRESAEFIRIIMNERNLDKLARLWVTGITIPWELIYADATVKPQRISLPTYPFAEERYWIPQINQRQEIQSIKSTILHPLLDKIDPQFSFHQKGLVFHKVFYNNEPVVREHCVDGQMTLPGVAYLEMALTAGILISGNNPNEFVNSETAGTSLKLSNVVWRQPLILDSEKKEVQLIITPQHRHMEFVVREIPQPSMSPILYAVGEIHFPENEKGTETESSNRYSGEKFTTYSLNEIKQRCTNIIEKHDLYTRVLEMGTAYGPSFKGVERIWANNREALSRFIKPSAADDHSSTNTYTLYPPIMDCALQTIIGIYATLTPIQLPAVIPFSLEEFIINRPLPKSGYSYAEIIGDNRFRVIILEEDGTPCVEFRDVAFRQLKRKNTSDKQHYFYYTPSWKPSPPINIEQNNPQSNSHKTVIVIYSLTSGSKEIKDALIQKIKNGNRLVQEIKINETKNTIQFPNLQKLIQQLEQEEVPLLYFLGGLQLNSSSGDDDDLETLEKSQERGVITLFRLVKELIHLGMDERPINLKAITNDTHQININKSITPYGASQHGLIKSLAKEIPLWNIAGIDISLIENKFMGTEKTNWAEKATQIIEEPGEPNGEEVVIRNGQRWIRVIEPIRLDNTPHPPFKSRGVYFILGGAGGIGLELSLHLAKTVQARLILIGRNPLKSHQEEKISHINAAGGEVIYIQADATDLESMKAAIKQAKKRFGAINGVIHSAIVLQDMTIKNMTEESLRNALAPKTRGTVILNTLFKNEKLDFMLFFSSAQSFTCLPGQSNYAAGCTFKDAYALYLEQNLSYPVKVINWGYWGSVGIVASETYNKSLTHRGIFSIEPKEGMEAVEKILSNPLRQVIPLKANTEFLKSIGVNLQTFREIYPKIIPSVMKSLKNGIILPSIDIKPVEKYIEGFDHMAELIPGMVMHVFQQMGVFINPGEQQEINTLSQQLKIKPQYSRLYTELLGILTRAGRIQINGNLINVTENNDFTTPTYKSQKITLATAKEKLIKQYPVITAHSNLLWACLEGLPQVLTGEKRYPEIMFPGGSSNLVEGIYTGTPISDFFHRLVAQVIKEYIHHRLQLEPEAVIHMLEIGAGTGGTSRFVLEAIREYSEHLCYWYTDISGSFTNHGQRTFETKYPFVKFKVLDIEKSIETQGFTGGTIDLVIGSNVLHATRNMRQTLEHAKRLLKTNGLLLVNEATSNHDYATLTFGLTDGWWCYEDEEIRSPGSPLLNPSQWKELLETEGIHKVQSYSYPGYEMKEFGQSVIIGESNGNVYEPIEISPNHSMNQSDERPVKQININNTEIPFSGNKPEIEELRVLQDTQKINIEMLTLDYVKNVFSEILKINKSKMDAQSTFERYGVDSLVGMDIINRFETDFGKLPATLLFEYMTLQKLANYFITQHPDKTKSIVSPALLDNRPGTPIKLPETNKEKKSEELYPTLPIKAHIMEPKPFNSEVSLQEMVEQLSDEEVDNMLRLLNTEKG